jgi:DNA-binding CsgD family transcriptional regulator
VIEAEVASSAGADGRNEALPTISRTFGLHGFRQPEPRETSSSDRAVLWISSETCLIGVPRKHSEPLPFVALVRPPSQQAFQRWHFDVARLALCYERGQLAWLQSEQADAAGSGAIDGIMSRLDVACMLVGAGRELVYANRAAADLLRDRRAMRIVDGRLSAAAGDRQRELTAAIQAAAIGEPRRPQALVLRDDDGVAPLVVTCLPLPGEEAKALVILGGRSRGGNLAELLLGAFGLTGAERRLACQLLAGRSLEEAAEETGIRISTARGYLKAVFAKIGVRRQGELVAFINAMVPPIALDATLAGVPADAIG